MDTAAKFFEERYGNVHLEFSIVDSGYNAESEVQKHLQADVILYFAPVYWMGIPAEFKSYFEKVYAAGRGRIFKNDGRAEGGQYGSGGLMQNTSYMLITSWNAPREAFNDPGQELFKGASVDEVFLGFHAMQAFTGMRKLPSFSTFDVKNNPDIKQFIKDFNAHLEKVFDDLIKFEDQAKTNL